MGKLGFVYFRLLLTKYIECNIMYYRKERIKMTISLRLNDKDSELIRAYASMHGMTVSELVRRTVLERIEDEYDLKAYEKAMEEYRKNPVTFTHAEVRRMLETDE